MKQRIATRFVTVLSLGILTFGLASACASEQTAFPGNIPDASVSGAGGAAGTCDPTFCQATGTGSGCCLAANGPCGVDYGMGCVQVMAAIDGG